MNYEIGIIGLGVMGHNLLLNIADHGFTVAGYDNDAAKIEALGKNIDPTKIFYTSGLDEFIRSLNKPRSIIILVPAGNPVDAVIDKITLFLEKNDLLIDSGNSHFRDTELRSGKLAENGVFFMGMGISGGEQGARNGPSLMPGGPKEAHERVRKIFESIAAKIGGEPCTEYIGPSSSGHYVKMVHNGIEYGIMQLISEAYAVMKLGLSFSDDQLEETFLKWNTGDLNSYLIEITGKIFGKSDEKTGKRLIDEIRDVSRQKGTGMWTSQSALELQVPIPVIDIAVSMRNLSVFEEERKIAEYVYRIRSFPLTDDPEKIVDQLRKSLIVSMILTYAQGFSLLAAASERYGYNLDLSVISRIWRGGCIVRSALLDDIYRAFSEVPHLPSLILDSGISDKIRENNESLRQIISLATSRGIAVPGLMASLGYLDSFRSSWLPANLIQAQRDFFGGHTYERTDSRGTFHTEWLNND